MATEMDTLTNRHPGGDRRSCGQRGETLIESLVSIMLLSIVVAAAFTGVQMAIKASALHHELAVAETLLRTAAEDLQNPDTPYVPLAGCAGHGTYGGLPTKARFGVIQTDVRFWNTSGGPAVAPFAAPMGDYRQIAFTGATTCPSSDPGLQKIVLRVTTPSGHTQSLEITKVER